MPSDARMLIAVRVVVVTTLLLAALIIQYTVAEVLPIDYLYATAAVTYGLTLLYIGVGQLIRSRKINLAIQLAGDLLVETLLVYFTGALDSPFSFLYLVSIIPAPEQSWITTTAWTTARLYLNIATNFAGFYATALLTSYIAEKLQKTSEELDEKGRIVAALRALNQNVVESIPSGLITLSPEGIVSFVNPAGCQILITESRSVIGRHVAEPGFFRAEEWDDALRTLQSETVVRIEKNNFPVADEDRSLGYALTPLYTLEGTASGYTLIFQDLTDMKKLEAELRLKDRMAAVGELSAGIAHEIRNPLAAIAGSVQVLRKSNALSQQEQRLMSIILTESERLNKSIADFLRFVKPQEKRPAEFDIAASLAETLELLRNSPELGTGHTIEDDIVPPSYTLVGDADQIRQVFWNIARNAVQAMPDAGSLRVTTGIAADRYNIVFSDNGRGMTEADQRRLFQPFRTSFPSGTGLGMAIS